MQETGVVVALPLRAVQHRRVARWGWQKARFSSRVSSLLFYFPRAAWLRFMFSLD
jgi:hypothetical protein